MGEGEERRFFCPRLGQSLFQDLDLEGLAAELTLELADALLHPAHLAVARHAVVRLHRRRPALGHQPAPPRSEASPPRSSAGGALSQ
jgi:hypothetical protein